MLHQRRQGDAATRRLGVAVDTGTATAASRNAP